MRNRLLGSGRDSWRAGRKVTSRFGFGGRFEYATFTGDVGLRWRLLLPPLLMLLLKLMALMALMAFFAPPGMNVQSRVQGALRVGRDWTLAAGTCQCELVGVLDKR
jgi:hypothetical protein